MGIPRDRLRALPWPAQIVVVALAHYAAARLGLAFGRLDGIVAPVWPPSGVALVGLWVFGLRAWPGVALSALAVDLGGGVPVSGIAGMVLGTTIEPVLAVALLRRVRFDSSLGRLRDVAALVGLGGVVASAAGAAVGAGSLVASGGASGGYSETWRVWWLGDVLGLLVVGPVLLTLVHRRRGGTRHWLAWMTGSGLLVASLTVVAFGSSPVPPYVLFPLLTWIAARGCTFGVTWATLVAAAVGVVRTSAGHGPMVGADPVESLYLLDGFLAVLSISGLTLAAVVRERNRAHVDVHLANQELEARITERTQALTRDRARLAEAQRIAKVGSWEWDAVADVVTWSDELCRIHGVTADQTPGRVDDYFAFVEPSHRQPLADVIAGAQASSGSFTIDYRIVLPDGTLRWVRGNGDVERDGAGAARRMVGTCQDITERRLAEERFRNLLDAAPDAMVIVGSDGRLELVNRQTELLLGYAREELVGQPVEVLLPERFGDGHAAHRGSYFAHPKTRPMGEGAELYARHKDGHEIPVEVSLSPLRTETGVVVSAAIRDVTSRKLAEEALAHQALHDSLTGLPNRTLLADRLAQSFARADRASGEVAVLFLDLDRFKLINDSLGHAAGDDVLVAVADRLRAVVRSSDTVARFGGDEFVVVCEDVDEAPRLADRLVASLRAPFAVEGDEVFLSVSVGVAIADCEVESPDAVLRDADAAMYRAKERGRARIECFDATMRTEAAAKLESHSSLHRALDRREFRVHYQPIIDLRTGQVARMEALVRWEHPERGLVSPNEFIPMAEESGLIVPLGAWVLEEAVRHHARWRRDHPSLALGVNVSARQLRHPGLVQEILSTLDAAALDPAALCLELTESVLIEDVDAYRDTLDELREAGVGVAIDDFGTGYSSLTYLRRFPADTVKIDQTFVAGVGSDAADLAIVESVIDLAHALGMVVVAEGVEKSYQLRLLRRLGCDLAQGYYFDPARPPEAVDRLLAPASAASAALRAEAVSAAQ